MYNYTASILQSEERTYAHTAALVKVEQILHVLVGSWNTSPLQQSHRSFHWAYPVQPQANFLHTHKNTQDSTHEHDQKTKKTKPNSCQVIYGIV